ncbi:MAG TPA: hypothetical protein VLG66_17845 [Alphaproteobacteria bacterium]|jgi:hypothetical protein|nr:hypothetical protein [Alphaproteobacteria bacterium]
MTTMNDDRLREILDAYGGDASRWPSGERAAAEQLLARSAAARVAHLEAMALDALLARDSADVSVSFDAAQLAAAVTAQRQSQVEPRVGVIESDIVLPATTFLFRWFNIAGLAAAMLAGFIVGWAGIDGDLGTTAEAADIVSGLLALEYVAW